MGWDPTKPLKDLWKKTKREMEGVANSLIGKIKKVGSDAAKSVTKRGDEIRGSLRSFGNEVEDSVKSIGSEIEDAVESAGEVAVKQIEEVSKNLADELEDRFEEAFDKAEDVIKDAMQAAMKEISKGALNKIVDVVQIVAPTSVDITLGPVTISIGDIGERIDVLQKWASNPPSGKDDLRAIIIELAPTAVSIELSFSLAFLVVQSDSLEIGTCSTYETYDFLNHMDDILQQFGINI